MNILIYLIWFIGKNIFYLLNNAISYRSSRKRVHMLSSLYGITSSVFFFAMAALISLGATLVNQGVITFQDFFM
jgi:hypothetical protein